MARVDVDAIAAEVARQKLERRRAEGLLAGDRSAQRDARRRVVAHHIGLPFAPHLEGRLLAAMLADRAVLELCVDVEVMDFAEMRHRVVATALRNVQAAGAWNPVDLSAPPPLEERARALASGIDAVGDELARIDARDDKHLRDAVDELFLAELLGRHMWETYGPPGAPIAAWVEHDARTLRELAERRRAL